MALTASCRVVVQAMEDRVGMVMDLLGLHKCADSMVGDASMRGISGGQVRGPPPDIDHTQKEGPTQERIGPTRNSRAQPTPSSRPFCMIVSIPSLRILCGPPPLTYLPWLLAASSKKRLPSLSQP